MIITRLEPIERKIELLLGAHLSPKVQSAHLAKFAREELKKAQAINQQVTGNVLPYKTFVDGRAEAALESVRPAGRIVFEFEVVLDLFAWIGAELVQHSPIGQPPLHYYENHIFLADGVQVVPGEKVPDAAVYTFANLVPYARKIEKGLSPQAPDGVYHVVAVLAQKRFGNVARVRFGYREIVGIGRQPAIDITMGR